MDAFVRAHSAEEQQVPTVTAAHGEVAYVDAVVYDRRDGKVGRRAPLRLRDRDDGHARAMQSKCEIISGVKGP